MAPRPRRRRDLRRRVRRRARRLGERRRTEGTAETAKTAEQNRLGGLSGSAVSSGRDLPKIHFLVPDRSGLPPLSKYATLQMPDGERRAGRLHRGEPRLPASVPALSGRADLRRPVSRRAARGRARRRRGAGRRRRASTSPSAIPTSSTARRTRCGSSSALHEAHPGRHLRRHDQGRAPAEASRAACRGSRATGCAFVTSAVESIDDEVLAIFDKGHTRADFVEAVAHVPRRRRDAGADVRRVPSVADAGVVLRSARHDRRARSGRSRRADSAGDPAAGAAAARGCWSSTTMRAAPRRLRRRRR